MKYVEAKKLKKGDLVVVSKRNKYYSGLVFEIEDITADELYRLRVTLKQPGFDNDFRIFNYDTRQLQRYES